MKIVKIGAGITLILSGSITCLFFSNYTGSLIPYPVLWYIAGILLASAGIAMLWSILFKTIKQAKQNWREEINAFKLTAHKIEVDLSTCEIKTNNYIEEVEKIKSSEAKFYDALYDPIRNVENREVNQAVLIFETYESGKKKQYYSPTIYKDETTLRFLLARQKQTFIYVDRNNKSHYYFDLEFLNE